MDYCDCFRRGSVFAFPLRVHSLCCMAHLRMKIPAVDNDDVLQSALHKYVTVGVHPTKITGSQVCIAGPRHTPG